MTPTQPPSTSDGRHRHDDPRPPDIGSGANRLLVLLGAVGIYVAGSVGPSVVSLAEIVTSRVSYADACHIVIVLLLLSVLALLARDFVPASVRQQLKARLFKVVMSCHLHPPTPASRCSSESASSHTIASDAPPATDAQRSNTSTAPIADASDVTSCHHHSPTPAPRCSSEPASFHSEVEASDDRHPAAPNVDVVDSKKHTKKQSTHCSCAEYAPRCRDFQDELAKKQLTPLALEWLLTFLTLNRAAANRGMITLRQVAGLVVKSWDCAHCSKPPSPTKDCDISGNCVCETTEPELKQPGKDTTWIAKMDHALSQELVFIDQSEAFDAFVNEGVSTQHLDNMLKILATNTLQRATRSGVTCLACRRPIDSKKAGMIASKHTEALAAYRQRDAMRAPLARQHVIDQQGYDDTGIDWSE